VAGKEVVRERRQAMLAAPGHEPGRGRMGHHRHALVEEQAGAEQEFLGGMGHQNHPQRQIGHRADCRQQLGASGAAAAGVDHRHSGPAHHEAQVAYAPCIGSIGLGDRACEHMDSSGHL
jgi:hypothetical protein